MKNKIVKKKAKTAQMGGVLNANNTYASISSGMYNTTPEFKTLKEHNDYYRKQLLERYKDTSLYNKYLEYGENEVGVNPDADILLAAMGGIPEFEEKVVSKPVNSPSRILDIKYKPKKTQGYRYKEGKPDKESITSYRGGGIIKDNMGQLAHPGKITQIDSNNITMKGVNYPVLGVSNTNDVQMMYPNQDYTFNGNNVTEFPIIEGFHKMPDGSIMNNAEMAKSGIRIKKSKKGTFTKAAKQRGKGVQEFARQVMANKEDYSPAMVKKANFAKNASKWNKGQDGLQPILSPQKQLNDILLKNALLQERQQKRDSVRYSLMDQYPNRYMDVNKGMLKYYETEPKEYLKLDINLLDENRKKNLLTKYGRNYKQGGKLPKAQFGMSDLPQEGATRIDLPAYQSQGIFDTFYGEQYQNASPQGQSQNGLNNAYNRIGGMQGVAQGISAIGYGLQGEMEEGGPSGAQRAVGQFGPWGAAISQASQIGTNITDKSNNEFVYTAGKTIFDPAAAWTNKDLSTSDRIIGGLNPIYGGIKAFQAKKDRERKQRMLEDLVNRAGASQDVNANKRRYVRPEDQVINPNELASTYGTGTNYLKHGGNVSSMEYGGELQTYWGGEAKPLSENPFLPDGGETVIFKGDSHEQGGIGMKFGKSKIEVEGGEPAVKLNDGNNESLTVFGDMKIPSYGVSELNDPKAKNKKFKNYIKDLSEIENKQNKIVETGVELINDITPTDSFDKLKISSGKAMIEGGNMKLKEIARKKEIASNIQSAILETAEELGLKSNELAKGKIIKDRTKKAEKAQDGYTIPRSQMEEYELYGYLPDPQDSNRMYRDLQTGNTTKTVPVAPPGRGGEEFNRAFAQARRQGVPEFVWNGKKYTTDLFQGGTKTITTPGATNRDYIYLQDDVNIPEGQAAQNVAAQTVTVEPQNNTFPWMSTLVNAALPFFRPSNQLSLDPNQLAGERYAMATNQLEPVKAQLYEPLLENVSDISLQDQLNANQADFNSLQRYTAQNPAAQATLAAQKYQANSSVLGEQFRQNQTQRMGVYNRNRGVLNDATLKNLAILDQQYVRQSQAKSNTKAIAQAAISSISDKIAKNKLENRTLGVYENLYNYRYDNKGRAWNMNPLAQFQVDTGAIKVDDQGKVVMDETKVKRDKNGMIINSTETQRTTDKKRNGGIVKAIKSL